jgi:hypothetical protein
MVGIRQEKPVPTKLEARVSVHDREIAAIRKLILQGIKMINSLAASQRKTDAQLQAFIRSVERGGNGHGKLP